MAPTVTVVAGDGEAPAQKVIEGIFEVWDSSNVVHVTGIEVERAELRAFYDRVVEEVGTPGTFAEDATAGDRSRQRTGERWMEVRYDPRIPNAYRHSANAQPLHTDGSYIPDYPNATLMYCESSAREGGETVFLDGPVFVELLKSLAPELLSRLLTMPMRHERSGTARTAPVVSSDGTAITLNWNYYCVEPDGRPEIVALREELFGFLRRPEVAARLAAVPMVRGDAVLWKDQRVLHGRNPFRAEAISERFIWKCAVDVGVHAPTR